MIGVLAILSALAGLALGLVGRDPVPVVAAFVVPGALLLGTVAVAAYRSRLSRRLIPTAFLFPLALGSLLLALPVAFGFSLLAAAASAKTFKIALWAAVPLSMILLVAAPLVVAQRYERPRRRRPSRAAPAAQPMPRVWDFSHPGRVVLAGLGVCACFLALLPLFAGWPPLELAIRLHSPRLTALCLAQGANLSRPGPWGALPVVQAVRVGDPALVAMLLDRGADPNERRSGDTPLVLAILERHPALVRLLLERGANPNLPSLRGAPLIVAAQQWDLESLDLLLDHGADPEQRDNAGCTAVAVGLRSAAVLERLLRGNASPDAFCGERNRDIPGDRVTPLMIAAAHGVVPAIHALLAGGAQLGLKSAQGKTALDLANERGQDSAIRLLKGLGGH